MFKFVNTYWNKSWFHWLDFNFYYWICV